MPTSGRTRQQLPKKQPKKVKPISPQTTAVKPERPKPKPHQLAQNPLSALRALQVPLKQALQSSWQEAPSTWIAVLTVLNSDTESVPAGVSLEFWPAVASIYAGGIRVQCAMWLVAVVESAQTLVSDRDLAAAGSASYPALHVCCCEGFFFLLFFSLYPELVNMRYIPPPHSPCTKPPRQVARRTMQQATKLAVFFGVFFGEGLSLPGYRPAACSAPPKKPRTRPSRAPRAHGVHAHAPTAGATATPQRSSRRRTGRCDPRRRRTRHPSCLCRSLEHQTH
jgi:hypothetical protein